MSSYPPLESAPDIQEYFEKHSPEIKKKGADLVGYFETTNALLNFDLARDGFNIPEVTSETITALEKNASKKTLKKLVFNTDTGKLLFNDGTGFKTVGLT